MPQQIQPCVVNISARSLRSLLTRWNKCLLALLPSVLNESTPVRLPFPYCIVCRPSAICIIVERFRFKIDTRSPKHEAMKLKKEKKRMIKRRRRKEQKMLKLANLSKANQIFSHSPLFFLAMVLGNLIRTGFIW